jgi:hypothetical protein
MTLARVAQLRKIADADLRAQLSAEDIAALQPAYSRHAASQRPFAWGRQFQPRTFAQALPGLDAQDIRVVIEVFACTAGYSNAGPYYDRVERDKLNLP